MAKKEKTSLDIVREAAQQYRKKANENYENYQTTGVGRFDTAYYKNDSIATALEKYLEQKQIQIDASYFKNLLANYGAEARAAKGLPDAERLAALDKLAEHLVTRVLLEGI